MDVGRISKFIPFKAAFGLLDKPSNPTEPPRPDEPNAGRQAPSAESPGRVVHAGTRRDTAEISRPAHLFQKAKEVVRTGRAELDRLPDIREEAVERARERVAVSFYDKHDVIDKTAGAILASGDVTPPKPGTAQRDSQARVNRAAERIVNRHYERPDVLKSIAGKLLSLLRKEHSS